jgi:hypothetical protein
MTDDVTDVEYVDHKTHNHMLPLNSGRGPVSGSTSAAEATSSLEQHQSHTLNKGQKYI